ncbi:MAG: hypothetical protein ACYTG5_02740 [Planctomycetota bacterium]|jgi:hypothetical protein
MNENEERILDLSLEEEMGGAQPPDLSDRIRWQLAQNEHRQSQIGLLRNSPSKSFASWAGALLGAAAALALIFFTVNFGRGEPQAALSFTVAEGSLRWQSSEVISEFHQPNTYTVFPVLGDRIESLAEDSTVLNLASLGTLEMSPGCALEVEEMKFSEFGKGFVVGAVVVAVAAGSAQFLSGDYAVQAQDGERLTLEQRGGSATGEPVSIDSLQTELAELRAENQRLIESSARRRAESPEAEAIDPPAEDLEVGVAVTYADFSETLEGMDWAQMGTAAKDMIPKLQELMKALEEGGELPIGLAGEIQQLNGQILQSLGKLQDGTIPGTGINGAFTHPVFAANLMNATLEAAGVSLTEAQLRNLQDVTGRFAGEDDSRRGSYGKDVPALQQVMEEIDLRNRFFEQAKTNLTPEQLAVLGNGPEGPGPMDLFSGDPAWQQFTKPVKVKSRADFGNKLAANMRSGMGLDASTDAARIAKLNEVIDKWAKAAPDSYLMNTNGNLAEAKAFPSANVSAAAHYQSQLFANIMSQVDLTPDQRRMLLKNRGVFVPVFTGK